MKKLQLFCLLTAVLAAAFALPVQAVIYVGNYTTTVGTNVFSGKTAISDNGKMWAEAGQTQMIMRNDKKVSWSLMMVEKTYSEKNLSTQNSALISMKVLGEIGRKKVGNEQLNAIECEKYKVTCKAGKKNVSVYQWTSADYPFPLKSATIDGKWSMELSQLQVSPSTDSVFDLPAGFTKTTQ
jgi:hypothetical protein